MFINQNKVVIPCSNCQRVTLTDSGLCPDCFLLMYEESIELILKGFKRFFSKIYHVIKPVSLQDGVKVKEE